MGNGVLAEYSHPDNDKLFHLNNPFELLGLSGCSLSGWHCSASTATSKRSA